MINTPEPEYHLSGTTEELQHILEQEFSMDSDVARFMVAVLTLTDDESHTQNEDLALWYMEQGAETYTTPLLNFRFSISFTEIKKELIERIFTEFAEGIMTNAGVPIVSLVLSCIMSIVKHSTRIKDDECCAYYCALKWRAEHPDQSLMSVKDIIPAAEEVCGHLDKIKDGKWKCSYCRDDTCQVIEAYFDTKIRNLASRDVFEFVGDRFRFKR